MLVGALIHMAAVVTVDFHLLYCAAPLKQHIQERSNDRKVHISFGPKWIFSGCPRRLVSPQILEGVVCGCSADVHLADAVGGQPLAASVLAVARGLPSLA